MSFPYRYVAQIIVKTITPLAVGSDSLQYDQDSPVDKDFNELPYIPGTAITGYLKKQLPNLETLFGDEATKNATQSKGSNIIVSDALLMNEKGKVTQQPIKNIKNPFLKRYTNLPIRQHTAINEFAAASEGSKFDTEIVYKGSRFKFEIELQLDKESNDWYTILNAFFQNNFYLGAGEFNNFGELKVIEIKEKTFNLKQDLDDYLNHDVDLNTIDDNIFKEYKHDIIQKYDDIEKITLSGKDSFFHFGAGYGDTEVDNVNYTEFVIEGWDKENGPDFIEKYVIPGTSIKGALSHRVAFHWNKENQIFVENLILDFPKRIETDLDKKYNKPSFKLKTDLTSLEKQKKQLEEQLEILKNETLNPSIIFKDQIGTNNDGVKNLFGMAKKYSKEEGRSGNIIIKDIYLPIQENDQTIFYHNKIDRYTGGTIDKALFSEKVLLINEVTLYIKTTKSTDKKYLTMALNDLKKGMLPLGGLVNKGHGIFKDKNNSTNNRVVNNHN